MAFRNVSRQRKRSLLLGGAIAFGVMIITLVQSFTGGLIETANRRVIQMLGGHVYVSGQELSVSGRIISVIGEQGPLEAALDPVRDATETIQFRSSAFGEMIFGSRTTTAQLTGVEWDNEPDLLESLEIVAGDQSSPGDPSTILVPEPLAAQLDVTVGESVLVRLTTITGQQSVGEFTVGGLLRDAGMLGVESVYADKAYLNSLIGMTVDQYQQVVLSLRDVDQVESVAATIKGYLASLGKTAAETSSLFGNADEENGLPRNGGDSGMMMGGMSGILGVNVDEADRWEGTRFTVTTINDVLAPILTIMRILNSVSLGLFVILLGITMVGLLNTFRMILIERTREIGTIRAVGMQRNQVRNLFLLEALILSLGGAAAGFLIALVLGVIASNIPIMTETPLSLFLENSTFVFVINPAGIVAVLLIVTAITAVAAYLPARKAAMMRPADALRATY